jgi:hypothetical protein
MICEKFKLGLTEILFVSTWAVKLYEAIFVAFVTLGREASYTAKRHPRAPKILVSREKVYENPLHLCKERRKS